MSEHRRKTSQPPGGGRAAARRAAQSAGRSDTPSRRVVNESPSDPYGGERQYGSRAEARRAQRGGGRRRGAEELGSGAGGHPGKKRLIDYPRAGKHGYRRWVPSWKLVSGVCLSFLGLLMGVAGVAYAIVTTPKVNAAAEAQNNVYYWADGKQMVATGGEVNRQEISYEQIPKAMRNAVISAENKTFENDKGIDPMGIARAVFNMAKGGETQGGSTITQQYVKNSRLSQDQTFSRKFKELFITLKVGGEMKKRDVMAGYLNVSYYGRGAWGLQAAARTYYNKDAKDLDPSQCAFLATLLKGATYFDPAGAPEVDPERATKEKNRERAEDRWRWILDEQVKDNRMEQSERAKYDEFPMPLPPRQSAELGGQIGYLVDLAKSYVLNNTAVTANELAQGGYEIHTTFQQDKVKELQKAVEDVDKANIDPEKRPDKDTHVQFGGASIDPSSGAIVATYGGRDATKHYTNNANPTGAQVGSTFKPFVLAAAMQYGKRNPELGPEQGESTRTPVSPESIYNGDNLLEIRNYNGAVWKNEEGKRWLQTNDGDESYGDIDLRYAMEQSANSPYVQLGMDVGTDKVKDVAMAVGLRDDDYMADSTVPSYSIGTSSPSAIRMAGAYATFATSGIQREPFSVTKVNEEGATIYQHESKQKRALDALIADNVTDVLKNVVENGTGTPAKLPGRDVAGKTGTTDGNRSAWFVGYTPQLSTAISMFRLDDDEKNKKREFLEMYGTGGEKEIHGASFPAQIWHDFMAVAMKGEKVKNFPKPQPWGEKMYGGGAVSPTPAPSITASPKPSPEPTTASPSPTTSSPTPSPSKSCGMWGAEECEETGGSDAGTGDGGTTEGATEGGDTAGTVEGADTTGATGETTEGNENGGNGNGNGNDGGGGFFGGTDG
ncbi:transglycosylase domain-containing protein [Streptomyces fulvorobeus]|uniref:Membrane peptidoglycan carboxypeptidase n=1 Tax=Streptomyces fulvorobeus TaxID=284028 RepID=A0A7J0C900_9ACTN|nr:transglycosylase domain-containing protein [Streptomyces fulvorobeus]NYE41846.1 membrane peptidoglycan carboxypeptidase [Streptomyces fulvorobeus]GFM98216.1 penicillin-binding protein [Streptomyces fulvorobeus]